MSARATTILSRFPRHLEVDAPGKLFGSVVAGLASDLDTQAGQLGEIRRSHRLDEAPTVVDVMRLAGVHGFDDPAVDLVTQRLAAMASASAVLADGSSDPADADAASTTLAQLATVDVDWFTDPADGADGAPALRRLGEATASVTDFAHRIGAARRVVAGLIAAHRDGNGTSPGLLRAAASYLGLAVDGDVIHTEDSWWHLATCTDELAPHSPDRRLPPAADLLAIEENPPQPADIGPTPRRHGERFAILKGGLEAVPVTVVVAGIEDRTVGPMVVNVNTGSGVALEGAVPDGAELRFHSDGRVALDGTSVLSQAYSFRGSVFADEAAPIPGFDFVFAADGATGTSPPRAVAGILDDHTAHWSVTEPVADAFASDGAFPHAEGIVEPVWLARGRTRWAVFTGTGTYALRWRSNGRIRNAAPRFDAAFFDRTVFEPDPLPAGAPSMAVGFEWMEREAFALRVWIPPRFALLDVPDRLTATERLRMLIDRHRAAGVRVTVEYADPRWTLGAGILRSLDSTNPVGLVVSGTTTWPAGIDQPEPG